MFDGSNIELDEKHSTGRGNQYLLRDDSGTIKLVMKVYRNPEIEALSFTFQPVCSIGLVPDFYVMLDRIEYMLEPNSMLSTINPKDLDQFIEDTAFAKEAGAGKGDRAVNVLNWLLVAAGLFMAFIGYACIVVGARSERDDWEERK